MTKTIIFCSGILNLFFLSCNYEDSQLFDNVPEIKIEEAFTEKKIINLSNFIEDNIEYIPLQTNEKCLIGGSLLPRVYVSNNNILVFSFRQIFLFNRADGSFIREIGSYDRGPNGYMFTTRNFPYDPVRDIVKAGGWDGSYMKYNLNGDLLGKVKLPEGATSGLGSINDSTFITYVKNVSGNEGRRLVVFTDNNVILKTFPNYNNCEPSSRYISWGHTHGLFYRFQEELRFFEKFTDTIYQVKTDELTPKYVLKMGEFAPPYEKQLNIERDVIPRYFFIQHIVESNNYLLFEFRHDNKLLQGLYNKETMNTYIAQDQNGFENGIDNFIPYKFTSINSNGEIIGVMVAWEVEQWFKDNPEKAAQLPPHLKKLESLTENDNPVVMIARLKE